MRESTDMAEINRELYPASKPTSSANQEFEIIIWNI